MWTGLAAGRVNPPVDCVYFGTRTSKRVCGRQTDFSLTTAMVSVMVRVCLCATALRLVSSAFLPHEQLMAASSNVLTTQQLNPQHPLDGMMELPMMMPMPLTTALHKQMAKVSELVNH